MRTFWMIGLCWLAACQSQAPVVIELRGPAQGTSYHIQYYGPNAANGQGTVDSMFVAVNQSLSTYQTGSLINQFNESNQLASADPMFAEMVDRSRKIAELTGGAFDPTVMPLVRAWGFGPDNAYVPNVSKLDSLLGLVGIEQVMVEEQVSGMRIYQKAQPGVELDFNAIAQGYTVDLLCRMLDARRVENYFVEVGGEVRTKGLNAAGNPWTVGVEKPIDMVGISELASLIEISDLAAATSGNYRKFYEKDGIRYSHTIDPSTGKPVQHSLLSTTVLAADGATADAFATAFMVMGLEKARAFLQLHPELELEAYFISSAAPGNYVFEATAGMQDQLIPVE